MLLLEGLTKKGHIFTLVYVLCHVDNKDNVLHVSLWHNFELFAHIRMLPGNLDTSTSTKSNFGTALVETVCTSQHHALRGWGTDEIILKIDNS